jgi:hypothetical protein
MRVQIDSANGNTAITQQHVNCKCRVHYVRQDNDSSDDIEGLDWAFQDPYSDSPNAGVSPVTVTSETAATAAAAAHTDASSSNSSKLQQLDTKLTTWLAAIDRDDNTATASTAADSDKHLSEADRKAAGAQCCYY